MRKTLCCLIIIYYTFTFCTACNEKDNKTLNKKLPKNTQTNTIKWNWELPAVKRQVLPSPSPSIPESLKNIPKMNSSSTNTSSNKNFPQS